MSNRTWHRVKAPTPWRPKAGQELIGKFVGSRTRSGKFGDYKIHMIEARGKIQYVSGAMTNDLFSLIVEGMKVKLVFVGTKISGNGNEYKEFELYSEEVIELKVVA